MTFLSLDTYISPRVAIVFTCLLAFLMTGLWRWPDTLLPVIVFLLVLYAILLFICTIRRWRTLKISTRWIHTGFLFILTGGFISVSGYTATVNIYIHDTASTFFRWDRQEDFNPGFAIRVDAIQKLYYPAQVKIGVLKDGTKKDLILTRPGKTFIVGNYQIHVDRLDPTEKILYLTCISKGNTIHTNTAVTSALTPPYTFQLVAYKTPPLKNISTTLSLLRGQQQAQQETISINSPVTWENHQISLTALAADAYGNDYVGLQITYDRGRPVVYIGFLFFCIGLLLRLKNFLPSSLTSPSR